MNKQVEQIRAELERLHEEFRGKKGDGVARRALRSAIFFIDSMRTEPIFQVGQRVIRKDRKTEATIIDHIDDTWYYDIYGDRLFKIESQDDYEVIEDLKEAERKYDENRNDLDAEIQSFFALGKRTYSYDDIARHFADWQKQQMMKNVTYGEVSQCATYPYNLKIQSIKTIDIKGR